MPKLNEYIGSIFSSVVNARIMSDLKTAEIALEYGKNDILSHFSIPRMRIDDVEITIPVALDGFNEKETLVSEPIDDRSFNSKVYSEIVSALGEKSLPAQFSRALQIRISESTRVLESKIRIVRNVEPVEDYVKEVLQFAINEIELGFKVESKDSSDVTKEDNISKSLNVTNIDRSNLQISRRINPVLLKKISSKSFNVSKISKEIAARLSKEIKIVNIEKEIEDLNVIVETHKIKEIPHDMLINIKMKISEQGMIWNVIDNIEIDEQGNEHEVIDKRLIPE